MPFSSTRLRIKFVYLILLTFHLGACSDAADKASTNPDNKNPLVQLQISPNKILMAKNSRMQLIAIGIYQDHTKRDLSASVSWVSSDMSTASFQSPTSIQNGNLQALRSGSIRISANIDSVGSLPVEVTVTDASLQSLQISTNANNTALDFRNRFNATGLFSDGSRQDFSNAVTWFSSAEDIAYFENSSTGIITTNGVGSSNISASFGNVNSENLLFSVLDKKLVSVEINPTAFDIALGTQKQMTATVLFDDGSFQDVTSMVSWQSSDTEVATINTSSNYYGLVRALKPGSTSISAKLGILDSPASTMVVANSVLENITLSSSRSNVPMGYSQQFIAIARYENTTTQDISKDIVWHSSSPEISDIDNTRLSSGLSQSRAIGETQISAAFRNVQAAPITLSVTDASVASINITPQDISLSIGNQQQYKAMASFSDGTEQDLSDKVNWTSSKVNIAIISNAQASIGKATAVSIGTSLIRAAFLDIQSNDATLSVLEAQLNDFSISSSSTTVALGNRVQFNAQGVYSDASTRDITTLVTWKSKAKDIATISNAVDFNGQVSTLAQGPTTISANYAGISKQTLLTVTAPELINIVLKPTSATITRAQTQQFTATGIFTNGPSDITASATWSAQYLDIATVSAGLAVPSGTGITNISASQGTNIVGSAILTIETVATPIVVNAINTGAFVNVGDLIYFDAKNGALPYTWSVSSTDGATASIDADPLNPNDTSRALFVAISPGTIIITATDTNNKSGTAQLIINP